MPKKSLTCCVCNEPMWQVAKSRPQGVAKCRKCQRAAPERRKSAGVPPPTQSMTCADCGGVMWKGKTSRPQGEARCLACKRANPIHKRVDRIRKPRVLSYGFCARCAHWFQSTSRCARFCSVLCSNRAKADLTRLPPGVRHAAEQRKLARRAERMALAFVEKVDRRTVFERDRWVCQLCGGPVPRSAKFPDPLSASLDHIIPISRDGAHSYRNTQLAHFGCNSAKNNRIPVLRGGYATPTRGRQ